MTEGSEMAAGNSDQRVPRIDACRSCPDQFVFIESENSDGWIATDYTVCVER